MRKKSKVRKTALSRVAYTLPETAAMLGVCYQTAWRLHKRGLLRSAKGIRTKLIPATEIERFLAER